MLSFSLSILSLSILSVSIYLFFCSISLSLSVCSLSLCILAVFLFSGIVLCARSLSLSLYLSMCSRSLSLSLCSLSLSLCMLSLSLYIYIYICSLCSLSLSLCIYARFALPLSLSLSALLALPCSALLSRVLCSAQSALLHCLILAHLPSPTLPSRSISLFHHFCSLRPPPFLSPSLSLNFFWSLFLKILIRLNQFALPVRCLSALTLRFGSEEICPRFSIFEEISVSSSLSIVSWQTFVSLFLCAVCFLPEKSSSKNLEKRIGSWFSLKKNDRISKKHYKTKGFEHHQKMIGSWFGSWIFMIFDDFVLVEKIITTHVN